MCSNCFYGKTDPDGLPDCDHTRCECGCKAELWTGYTSYQGTRLEVHMANPRCRCGCEAAVFINELPFAPACAVKALDECDESDFAESEAA